MKRLLTLDGAPRTPESMKPKQKEPGPKTAAKKTFDAIRADLRESMARQLQSATNAATTRELPIPRPVREVGGDEIARRLDRNAQQRELAARVAQKPHVTVMEGLRYLATLGSMENVRDFSTIRDMAARPAFVSERQFEYAKALCLRNRTWLNHVFDTSMLGDERYTGNRAGGRGAQAHAGQKAIFDCVYQGGDDREFRLTFPYYVGRAAGDRKTIVQSMNVPRTQLTYQGQVKVGARWRVSIDVDWIRPMRGLEPSNIVGVEFVNPVAKNA